MKSGPNSEKKVRNVNFNVVLRTARGQPIQIEEKAAVKDAMGNVLEPAETRDMTLADAAINALDATDPDDKAFNGPTNKLTRYRLIQKVVRGEGAIDATEAALITTLVGKFYPPSIYGQVNDMLAPNTNT